MAEEEKKAKKSLGSMIGGVDDKAEGKGSFWKTLWQLVKFLVVSSIVTIIQLALSYLLPLIFDMKAFKHGLPAGFLQNIFNPNTIFDIKNVASMDKLQALYNAHPKDYKVYNDIIKYVIDPQIIVNAKTGLHQLTGVVTWGYTLPFLLSNLIANIYGYIRNKKTTFKSDAKEYVFVIYIIIMLALILFSTWFQGWLYGIICSNAPKIAGLARLLASMAAGFIQMVFLFPMEKFVLLREKKKPEDENAGGDDTPEAPAEA